MIINGEVVTNHGPVTFTQGSQPVEPVEIPFVAAKTLCRLHLLGEYIKSGKTPNEAIVALDSVSTEDIQRKLIEIAKVN